MHDAPTSSNEQSGGPSFERIASSGEEGATARTRSLAADHSQTHSQGANARLRTAQQLQPTVEAELAQGGRNLASDHSQTHSESGGGSRSRVADELKAAVEGDIARSPGSLASDHGQTHSETKSPATLRQTEQTNPA